MHEITVESALGEQLGRVPGQTIVCDTEGRVLGFFSPAPDRPKREDLNLEPPWTIEESRERSKARTGKPLSEILNRLGIQ